MTQTATETADGIAAALAEDIDAGFVALFEAHRSVLFSTALRVCGSWADAEDLTATAFLRAYRALSGYDAERIAGLRLRPWLLTILLNAWRNQLRTAARRPREVLAAEPDADPGRLPGSGQDHGPAPAPGVSRTVSSGAASAEDVAEQHETARELAGMLRRLPRTQRAAVVLRYVADLPVAEVAAVLGCPEGTAKSHISRGVRRLRELQSEGCSA